MLTRDERRRFDEIARRMEQEAAAADRLAAAAPARPALVPVRLLAAASFVIGATGVVTGIAARDLVILTSAGVVPSVVATILVALVIVPASAPPAGSTDGGLERAALMLGRMWAWLTTCAEDDCDDRPVHLGWCREHAPAHDPGPDEYWGDRASDLR